MGSFSHVTQFSLGQPHSYPECAFCPFVTERMKSESEKSLAKYGKLDLLKLTITCEGNIIDQKVMWATHDGIRYSRNNIPGIRMDGIMLSGGEFVNCPALRK